MEAPKDAAPRRFNPPPPPPPLSPAPLITAMHTTLGSATSALASANSTLRSARDARDAHPGSMPTLSQLESQLATLRSTVDDLHGHTAKLSEHATGSHAAVALLSGRLATSLEEEARVRRLVRARAAAPTPASALAVSRRAQPLAPPPSP